MQHRLSVNEVLVLLATFNGEKYLRPQLESILGQTSVHVRILARDDGSSDDTVQILQAAAAKHPDRIALLADNYGRLGTVKNFDLLVNRALSVSEQTGIRHFLFSDQDDVWMPHKTEVLLRKMQSIETDHPGLPVLVHSDLRVVDSRLRVLAESLWRYQGINPCRNTLNRLILQNTVTGCATMINVELARVAHPFPDQCIMHDWWLALVAAELGRIEPISDRLVLYRQHGNNETGARRYGIGYALRNARNLWDRDGFEAKLERHIRQVEAFYGRFRHQISVGRAQGLKDLINLRSRSRMQRRAVLLRNGFLASGILRNVGILLRV